MNTAFAVGTGRCGTKFISELIGKSGSWQSFHEKDPMNDTFLRYITWYQLPIDAAGCWSVKQQSLARIHTKGDHYFEASAYFSMNVPELYHKWNTKVILLVRHPIPVILSYLKKGWYSQAPIRINAALPPSFQPILEKNHHHFSRIVGYGEEGATWEELGKVGKLAWYWRLMNAKALEGMQSLPETHKMIVRLEDLNYQKYLELTGFLNIADPVSERSFTKIVRKSSNQTPKDNRLLSWSEKEIEEYEYFVQQLEGKFGYELSYDANKLIY